LPTLPIIIETDPRQAKPSNRLRQRSERIATITPDIAQLAADMHETMHVEHGVGLAAPQVGHLIRLIVIHVPEGYQEPDIDELSLTLINPEIIKAGGREWGVEGCLSFPELIGDVERYAWVNVKAQDIEGKPLRIKARGVLARILQHEIDHLDGVLFFDRMEDWSTLGYAEPLDDLETEAATA
jgi:peptide deformylase